MRRGGTFIHYGWVILLIGFIGVMGSLGFGRFAYTPILPSMKEGLSLTYTQMGWIGTGNFIGYLSFAFIGGYLATRLGSRQIISASLALVGFGLILTGLSESFEFALIMRSLVGAGSAGSNVPIMTLASVHKPRVHEHRSSAGHAAEDGREVRPDGGPAAPPDTATATPAAKIEPGPTPTAAPAAATAPAGE